VSSLAGSGVAAAGSGDNGARERMGVTGGLPAGSRAGYRRTSSRRGCRLPAGEETGVGGELAFATTN
jgi:hypothetical protein